KDGDGDDDDDNGDDCEEGDVDDDDDHKHTEEETKDKESFDPIPKTPKNSDDEGNGEEDLDLNVSREEGHDEKEEEDELYRDININQGRGIQTTQEVKDSHVTLTPVNPDGMKSIFETTSQIDVQTPTSVAPLPMSAPTITSSIIATITTTQQAPLPPTTAPSTLLQDLPNFGIVHRYMDQRKNEAVQVAVQLQSDRLCEEVTLKRRHDDDANKDEEPFARSNRGTSASESAAAEEPMQTTFEMEEPSHLEFETGANDQPIVKSSQHPEWFFQQQKPPTSDPDWNKTLSASHGSIQP
nr:hypothetical protein [Tanacetum cinerariifolium]